MPALALMTFLWAVAWVVIVFGGGRWLEGISAALVFGMAFVVFGLGECMHGPTQGALVADLAPPRLRGCYMALSTLSWEVGFVIGPATAGFILDWRPLRALAAGRLHVPCSGGRRASARAEHSARTAADPPLRMGR